MLTHDQIADQLRKRIERGDLKPDSALPPERLLAEDLGVSRMTVHMAIDQLAKEGLLVRRPDRRTLVAGDKNRAAPALCPSAEEIRNRTAGGLIRSCARAQRPWRTFQLPRRLNLEIGAKVIYLERLRFADGEPLALERVHLPYARFAPLLSLDLTNQSLYTVMEEDVGRAPAGRGERRGCAAFDPRSRNLRNHRGFHRRC